MKGMTLEEFKDRIFSGHKVLCRSAEERTEVLELLDTLYFELSPTCRDHLERQNLNPDFLCPGLDAYSKNGITCYRTTFVEKSYADCPETVILYKDIPFPLMDISKEEFQAAFSELCGLAI